MTIGEAGIRSCAGAWRTLPASGDASSVENCGLTAANCKDLCGILAAQASLRELDLAANALSDRASRDCLWECESPTSGCRDLCRVLRAKEGPEELSLAGKTWGEGAKLCESLLQPSCQLEAVVERAPGEVLQLTAACCPHSHRAGPEQASLELQLSSNKLGDEGVQELCRGCASPAGGADSEQFVHRPVLACLPGPRRQGALLRACLRQSRLVLGTWCWVLAALKEPLRHLLDGRGGGTPEALERSKPSLRVIS
ncbi:Ribonuclease inhibitor [Camelus dromedarius]|uniref:Ribonuclease inhibitor n=1 Tax=Camelus dromedarius TaxID=9838 RepID=A0A5N4BY48_CAMDR|nr:Ribonuclease inhibitor [Camelus dromedarius]KAB1251354.1 Ribonuclease inhibitor [Camelus dromedarius]